jgi:hypothetical protein
MEPGAKVVASAECSIEPTPCRTLVETDTGSSLVTTFNVTPQGDKSLVSKITRLSSIWDGSLVQPTWSPLPM